MREMSPRMRSVLQISTADAGGGAEKLAHDLHQAFRARGICASLTVGYKRTEGFGVLKMDSNAQRNWWARIWIRLGNLFAVRGCDPTPIGWRRRFHLLGQPRRLLNVLRGREDFDFPATWRLLEQTPERPDMVHGHNLHGEYFDLRALPWLSQQVPLVLTLHDAWLLSGRCAHSFTCERWRVGCGLCRDLSIYPNSRRDATAFNWRRKHDIYKRSRLYVATPSRWLMDRVRESMLMDGTVDSRVIPYGVNLSAFQPADRRIARAELGLPEDARLLLFVANGIRQNPWKDYRTLRAAIALVAERLPQMAVQFLALGEDAPPERIGAAEIRFVPYQKESAKVARHFQSADLYVHAARVDTFPTTVLESLACGTPVVATAVGGIPEQVKSLDSSVGGTTFDPTEATGLLTLPGDPESLAMGIVTLLQDDELRRTLGVNAGVDARHRFDLERQASDYLSWYDECIDKHRRAVEKRGRDAMPRFA
jgi:glycosyltransferase involved in cell wall biosynthesis